MPARRRTYLAALCALTCLASLGMPARAQQAGCAPAQDASGHWPMFGQNLQSDRNQTAETFLDSSNVPLLQPAWTLDANRATHTRNNEITGYPIEADGCIFVGSSTGNDANGRHLPGWIFALNADTGDVVWQRQVDGAVYNTLAVSDHVVYAFVSVVSAPYVVALDESTGAELWSTVVGDDQLGSDAVSSPVVYDGMVWVGLSGTNAETSGSTDRAGFEGDTILLAAGRDPTTPSLSAPVFSPIDTATSNGTTRLYRSGEIIRKLYTIPTDQWQFGYAGGSQWGTISIDPDTGFGYEGTGNPFNYDSEYATTNSILKIDLDRTRATFGTIVAHYKGDIEQLVEQGAGVVPCSQIDDVSGFFGAGLECAHLDLDFGATPNIVVDPATGEKLIVSGQKSGVVHFVRASDMTLVRSVRLGIASPVGGMVGSAATDCSRVQIARPCSIYGSHTVGGYLYSVDRNATPAWVTPTGDGVHWGPPVTLANGIIYTVDLKGFFDAYDAQTGLPLLHRPIQLPGIDPSGAPWPGSTLTGDPATIENPPLSWGAATVARNTVYVSTGVGLSQVNQNLSMPDGFVVAYRALTVP